MHRDFSALREKPRRCGSSRLPSPGQRGSCRPREEEEGGRAHKHSTHPAGGGSDRQRPISPGAQPPSPAGGTGEEPAFPRETRPRDAAVTHCRSKKELIANRNFPTESPAQSLRRLKGHCEAGRSGETWRSEFSRYPLVCRCPTSDSPAETFKAAEGRGATIPASLQKSQGVQSLHINKEKVMG